MKYLGPEEVSLSIRPQRMYWNDAKPSMDIGILGVDPGGTTGWSLLKIPKSIEGQPIWSFSLTDILEHKISWFHGQIDARGPMEDAAINTLSQLIVENCGAAIVLEDFILRPARNEKTRDLLSPVRINAVLQHFCWNLNRVVLYQQPALAKTTATDDRLKLWGVYIRDGGLQHARDADRHVITFMRRCMNKADKNIRQAAWPHLYPKKIGA